MASTILVNSLKAQSGTEVEVPTGFTLNIADTGALKVNDVAITVGSSNIARKTADYTVLEADVSGKSELVITCNASSSNRTITLPAVATSGLSTCIITIVADADATSTYKLMVQDSASAEVWTGYQKNDFVRLVVSNSVWVVLDHKETYYSRFYLTASYTLAASGHAQMTGWTEQSDIGNIWVNGDNEIVTPANMTGFIDVSYSIAKVATYAGTNPALKLDDVYIAQWDQGGHGTDQHTANTGMCGGIYPVTTAQELEFWVSNSDSDETEVVFGGNQSGTYFTVKFTRTY